MTVAEASALCGVAPRTLRELAQKGTTPARKLGRDWVFRRSDIAKLKPRPVGYPKGRPRPKRKGK